MTEERGEIFKELAKEGGSFWNNADAPMLLLQHLNGNLLAFPPQLSHFVLKTKFIQTNNKNKIIRAFKILK